MIKIVKYLKLTISWSSDSSLIKRPPFDSSRHENSNDMYYIAVALILTELFHLEYLNLQSIISRSSDWISITRPPFNLSYREESNDIYYISVALILTELFRFEFYNKNLTLFTLFTLFRPYFDPISTLGGSRTRPFRPWGFNFGFMYTQKWSQLNKLNIALRLILQDTNTLN